jgi:hypothetical protein
MVYSMADAEFGAVFVNAKEGTVTHATLSEVGHKQDTAEQNRSKAMDMRFYWAKYRVELDQFNVGWAPG